MKKIWLLTVLLMSAAPLTAGAQENVTEAAAAPETEAGLQKDLVVLVTSDVHCGVDQNFGLDGVVDVRDYYEAQDKYTLLADDGDFIQGEPLGTMTNGSALIDLMNAAGYDIAIPGNHEFDFGMDTFLSLTDRADFPYISCNFNKDGELVFEPYVIKEFDGVKFAFVGVTTPKTLTSSTPKYFQDDQGNFVYGFFQDDTGETLYDKVQEAVDSARSEGADYVIAMCHLGEEDSVSPWRYDQLIANTTGIDVLLDGHSHDTDQAVVKNKEGSPVPRMGVGTKLSCIGTVTFATDGSITPKLLTWGLEGSAREVFRINNDVTKAITEATEELDEKLSEVVAHTDVALTINDPAAFDSAGDPIRIVRSAETNLGDLCADAYRAIGDSDIGLVNGGGIRDNIAAGDITRGDILKVQPYGNLLCTVKATGQQILDALEWGARNCPEENGGFLQVSGLTYEIHTELPNGCTEDENGIWTGHEGEYRVQNVMVGGEPLELEKVYTVTSHDYMLKNNGDGQASFAGCEVVKDEIMVDNQALMTYITEKLGGTVGADYEDPYGQERIIAVEG